MKMTYGRQFMETSVGSFLKTEPTSAPFDNSGRQFMEISASSFFQTETRSFLEYDHTSVLPTDLLEKPQGDGVTVARTMCGGFKVGQTIYAKKQLRGRNEEGESKDVKVSQGDAGVVGG